MKNLLMRMLKATFMTTLDSALVVAADTVKGDINRRRMPKEMKEIANATVDSLVEELKTELHARM